jgi:hypothetical protein
MLWLLIQMQRLTTLDKGPFSLLSFLEAVRAWSGIARMPWLSIITSRVLMLEQGLQYITVLSSNSRVSLTRV